MKQDLLARTYQEAIQENKELKEQVERLSLIIGIKEKRHLISKFNKEYNKEYLSKTKRRDIVGVSPDAEEVYKKYYNQKDKLDKIKEYINEVIIVDDTGTTLLFKEEIDKLLSIIDKENDIK